MKQTPSNKQKYLFFVGFQHEPLTTIHIYKQVAHFFCCSFISHSNNASKDAANKKPTQQS